MTDSGDRWSLSAAGQQVTSVSVDWAVTLTIGAAGSPIVVRIEQPFALAFPGAAPAHLNPEGDPVELAPVLRLVRAGVSRLDAFNTGRLELELVDGTSLSVSPVEQYEAWSMAGPDGFKLVCLPGGELAVWSATSTSAESRGG